MSLFESLLILLFVAALLLTSSRRLGIPYPTLLSIAGIGVALIPSAPTMSIEPRLALALFIAPALLDAAYDTSPRELMKVWVPLVALAVGAVIATTIVVALLGWHFAGLPPAAAVVLGAIVAPTDAVAANTVMSQVGLPRHSSLVIQGESLLNDATALLIFGVAVALAMNTPAAGGLFGLAIAAPGGILFGLVAGRAYVGVAKLFAGTLSSILMQFTGTFGMWLLADWLRLSPVLALVAFAMVLGQLIPSRIAARDRVQSYAVWAAVVFVLNVLAFLFMGLQVRAVVTALPAKQLWPAGKIALLVLVAVIVVRFLVLGLYHVGAGLAWRHSKPRGLPKPASWGNTLVLSWCGTRGLLTLATSFALPNGFPGRDTIVLCAMSVVLGTLIVQGLTLKPLILALGVGDNNRAFNSDVSSARVTIIQAGLESAAAEPAPIALLLREQLQESMQIATSNDPQSATRYDAALARAVAAQRVRLHQLRAAEQVTDDVFHRLEAELDWLEMAATPSRELEILET